MSTDKQNNQIEWFKQLRLNSWEVEILIVGFVLVIRFITIFPILYTMKQGVRVSLMTTINLAQMSEFALVFMALGTASGHISGIMSSSIVLAIIITSTISTYSIQYNHNIYSKIL